MDTSKLMYLILRIPNMWELMCNYTIRHNTNLYLSPPSEKAELTVGTCFGVFESAMSQIMLATIFLNIRLSVFKDQGKGCFYRPPVQHSRQGQRALGQTKHS